MTKTLQERFDEKYEIVEPGGCWVWMGCLGEGGYGQISVNDKAVLAHRVSWELHVGKIPVGTGYLGTCVLHRCDNPSCVRPDHLFLGSQADNIQDMMDKGRRAARSGENSPAAKLTDKQVDEIRCWEGAMTQQEMADIQGVTKAQVSHILCGRSRVASTRRSTL